VVNQLKVVLMETGVRSMELILDNSKLQQRGLNSLDALKSLSKLLVHEIESLAELAISRPGISPGVTQDLNDSVQRYEVALICNALMEANGNQSKAAKQLGIKTTTLHAKVRRYGLDSMALFGRFDQTDDDVANHARTE
jgi:DNA-binding NtrC family response regulator